MKTILLILALATGATAAALVTITLKSGGTMNGPLVAKSAKEIKIETAYGIISLAEDKVAPESWKLAQTASPSKPSEKYVQPNPGSPPTIAGNGKTASNGRTSPAVKAAPYEAGFSDGRLIGKHDAATSKKRDGEKAMRLG